MLTKGMRVSTPYGQGVLEDSRKDDNIDKVVLDWQLTGKNRAVVYLPRREVKHVVKTAYGLGVLERVRREDSVLVVQLLEWKLSNGKHALAYIPPRKKVNTKRSPGGADEKRIPVGSKVAVKCLGRGVVEAYRESDEMYKVRMAYGLVYLSSSKVRWLKKLFEMSTMERIQAAGTYKLEGNEAVAKRMYLRAIKLYDIARDYLRHAEPNTSAEQVLHTLTNIQCNNNIALCRIKVKDHADAANEATKSIELDPSNIKAYYIRAKANLQRGELELAKKDLIQALHIDPDNSELHKALKHVSAKLDEAELSQEKAFANAFVPEKDAALPVDKKQNHRKLVKGRKSKQEQKARPEKFPRSSGVAIGMAVVVAVLMTYFRAKV